MAYATPLELSQRISLQMLAQASAPDHQAVDGDLLEKRLSNADVSALEDDLISNVDAAINRIQQALDDATAEINGYISTRYTLPVEKQSDVLKVKTIDIAVYRLLGGDRDSQYARAYKVAISFFEEVARGKIDLIVDEYDVANSGEVLATAPERVFNQETLKHF